MRPTSETSSFVCYFVLISPGRALYPSIIVGGAFQTRAALQEHGGVRRPPIWVDNFSEDQTGGERGEHQFHKLSQGVHVLSLKFLRAIRRNVRVLHWNSRVI